MNKETKQNKQNPQAIMDSIYDIAKGFMKTRQRRGQALMNALFVINSPLYNQITGTEADCFYQDSKIPAFEIAVIEYYEEHQNG